MFLSDLSIKRPVFATVLMLTLVTLGGETVQSEAIGWSDLESRRPMRADTLFRIASMTKPVTSLAALMLVPHLSHPSPIQIAFTVQTGRFQQVSRPVF